MEAARKANKKVLQLYEGARADMRVVYGPGKTPYCNSGASGFPRD